MRIVVSTTEMEVKTTRLSFVRQKQTQTLTNTMKRKNCNLDLANVAVLPPPRVL